MLARYKEIRKELEGYDKKLKLGKDGLASKKEIIILTKSDVVSEKVVAKKVAEFKKIPARSASSSASAGGNPKVFTLSLFDDKMIKKLGDELTKILRTKAPTPKGSGSLPKASGK